ncbi:uncharacterized protein Z518_05147 [Rhinocladiella mackenziei CBS 650.93]|uniref:Uncharacterized protein n=1 Tax=Rhinocladiella mackenziei CBS 650.93 TaxID=1442369 RepID=A0A0D2J5G6_9EURO|nr:uncharacterized protein Z518_05147 [Rhinocladiella mackenziei CBS 650.93]KIX04280.1 hypothetical protein Z518_05147 [Rhinocladiella mackenziei CBS 650.93]
MSLSSAPELVALMPLGGTWKPVQIPRNQIRFGSFHHWPPLGTGNMIAPLQKQKPFLAISETPPLNMGSTSISIRTYEVTGAATSCSARAITTTSVGSALRLKESKTLRARSSIPSFGQRTLIMPTKWW